MVIDGHSNKYIFTIHSWKSIPHIFFIEFFFAISTLYSSVCLRLTILNLIIFTVFTFACASLNITCRFNFIDLLEALRMKLFVVVFWRLIMDRDTDVPRALLSSYYARNFLLLDLTSKLSSEDDESDESSFFLLAWFWVIGRCWGAGWGRTSSSDEELDESENS